jgi:hypothetical protein
MALAIVQERVDDSRLIPPKLFPESGLLQNANCYRQCCFPF